MVSTAHGCSGLVSGPDEAVHAGGRRPDDAGWWQDQDVQLESELASSSMEGHYAD